MKQLTLSLLLQPLRDKVITITDEEINLVMEKLNNRPRKSLDFKPPKQVFFTHNRVALAT